MAPERVIEVLGTTIGIDDLIKIDFGKGPHFGKIESFYRFPVKYGGPYGIKFTGYLDHGINSIPVKHIKSITRFDCVRDMAVDTDFKKQEYERLGY